MAELFLAKDTRHDRMVVLKRILPYLAEEVEFVRMFLDEARIAASLHHPSIVELYELGHLENSTFIAMEWVDGIDLRRMLQKEQARQSVVPPGVGAWFVARLCEGLHHAHNAKDSSGKALGIIHRDVSPQNVMVSFKADVKLVDFGIAKATAWMGRSKPGVIKGKFLYLAPEQLTTEPLDHRTDLFALGTMLYELTTGQSPFYRTSTEAVIYAIRMEDPDPPTKVRANFPPGLSKIILKCLAKDRAKRYQTAEEIRLALEHFLRDEVPTTSDDALAYVSSLFGDDSERTSIFVPQNAQSPAESRTDTSTTRSERRLSGVKPGPPVPAPALPEGRRPTGEPLRAELTAPPKPERPREAKAIEPDNPWDPEVTASMPSSAVAEVKRRDFQATTEFDERSVGSGDVPPTSVSVSGERDVEVGQVFAPLVPTLAGFHPVPDLPPAKKPPPRGRGLVAMPAPPPSYDSLPELSVVSAGEATQGALLEDLQQRSEVSLPSQPTPTVPTRPPPRRGPPTGMKRRPPRDPDDDVATVDQSDGFSGTGSSGASSQKVFLGIFGVAAVVVLLLLAVLLWPSTEPETPKKTAPLEKVTPKKGPAPKETVTVLIRAMKGTTMTVDGKRVAPNTTIERPVGELVLKFTCPMKKQVKMTPGTLRAKIPPSDTSVAVEVPCPR